MTRLADMLMWPKITFQEEIDYSALRTMVIWLPPAISSFKVYVSFEPRWNFYIGCSPKIIKAKQRPVPYPADRDIVSSAQKTYCPFFTSFSCNRYYPPVKICLSIWFPDNSMGMVGTRNNLRRQAVGWGRRTITCSLSGTIKLILSSKKTVESTRPKGIFQLLEVLPMATWEYVW